MKALSLTLLLVASFIFSKAQSFELVGNTKDTINMTDAMAKKQGKWVIMGYSKKGTCYKEYQKIEEGLYKNNKRVGVWIEYYCNNKIKSKITYIDGKPNGLTTTYYESGVLNEQGTWVNNRWIGNYKFFDVNGKLLHEYIFDEKGKKIEPKVSPSKKKK